MKNQNSMTKNSATNLEREQLNLIISFTQSGKDLGENLKSFIKGNHIISREFDGDVRDYISNHWRNLESIIFIGSTGIAVRYIKDSIISKDVDPAIIVIDDMGKNVISLLSGHLGGGNELTLKISEYIGANPIITTGTDNRGIEAVDVFSKRNNYLIEDIKSIKTISMLMLENKTVGFYSEMDEVINYSNIKIMNSIEDCEGIDGAIVVTSIENLDIEIPHIILRPKNVNVGVGCRKGADGSKIIEAINSELKKNNLSKNSLKALGTVEAKRNEKGIDEACKHFEIEKVIFSNEEIKKVEDKFEKSEFVYKTIGVYNVSEPSAYLLGGKLIARKKIYDGITISLSVEGK